MRGQEENEMLERVREEIAKEVASWCNSEDEYTGITYDWEQLKTGVKEMYLDIAAEILSIKAGNHTLKELIEMIDKGELVKLAKDQSLTSYISFNLGLLQGEIGGLFENYPENFNLIMAKLGDKLKGDGFRRVEPLK